MILRLKSAYAKASADIRFSKARFARQENLMVDLIAIYLFRLPIVNKSKLRMAFPYYPNILPHRPKGFEFDGQ
jgi:hypothetical protein